MIKKNPSKSSVKGEKSYHLSLPTSTKMFRPTWVEINRKAFSNNIQKIGSALKSQTKIMAVVKANAYGHMALPISKLAEKSVYMLGVSSIEEGVALRAGGIKKNILILGSIYPLENLTEVFKHNLIPTISSLSGVEELSKTASKLQKTLPFHLKIDTGMGRIGISPKNAPQVLEIISTNRGVRLEGIYTHFSSAGSDPDFTRYQLKELIVLTNYAKKLKFKFISHAANSDAIFLHPESQLDMVRPGISLYGLWPYDRNETNIKLDPVLSWKTKIVFLKNVSEGSSISYGKTFITKRPSVIATLPVGYADGYYRNLSNKGVVLIQGKRCPIIGRVTMDMIMVDVTDLEKAEIGDETVLIGSQGEDQITAKEVADLAGTINYEIVCSISYRVPRIMV